MGYFLNPVALRTQLSGSMTFRQLVQRVRGTLVGAQANSEAHALPCARRRTALAGVNAGSLEPVLLRRA